MNKILIIIFLLLFLCIISVYAEEVSSRNTLSGGISGIYLGYPLFVWPGLDIEYERLLHKNFALAVDIGLDGIILPHMDLYARWYPWAGIFFANIGLGIWRQGFGWILKPVISPGIGWKIDIGKTSKWNLATGIIGRIFFYEESVEYNSSIEKNNYVDITVKAFFRVGYSF